VKADFRRGDELPKSIDVWEMARLGRSLSGSSPLAAFDRVAEALGEALQQADTASGVSVRWQIEGFSDRDGRCTVRLSGSFDSVLTCMRCGGFFAEEIGFDRLLRLCKSEQEADTLETDEDEDAVAAVGRVSLSEWLEDELLLSLPMFPVHNLCPGSASADQHLENSALSHPGRLEEAGTTGDQAGSNRGDVRQDAETHRPFETLARLMKKPGNT